MSKILKRAFLILLSITFTFMIACNSPSGNGGDGDQGNNGDGNPPVDTDWVDVGASVTDYDFSFMVIGDTQIITSEYPNKLKNIYDYVLDNVDSKKVKHVFGVGDITDRDTQGEWAVAIEQIARLDEVVPYSVIRGNHDIYSADKN